jgi:hypothetical protein
MSSTYRLLCETCDEFQTMRDCDICEREICPNCSRHLDQYDPCVPQGKLIRIELDNVYVRDVLKIEP